jgi:hypothetical protein
VKQLRLSEEQLAAIKRRITEGREVRTHRIFPGVDIDKIHRNPKYGNRKTEVDGKIFDSKREAERYRDLRLLEAAGKIKALETQVRFELKVKGHLICSYVADFRYREMPADVVVVEDSKGMKTRDYIIKKKLMKACWGIEVKET